MSIKVKYYKIKNSFTFISMVTFKILKFAKVSVALSFIRTSDI